MILTNDDGVGTVTALITRPLGTFVQRYPYVVAAWVIGLLILFFAEGYQLTAQQEREFDHTIAAIDWAALEQARLEAEMTSIAYYNSKGWFWQCDAFCMRNWDIHVQADARRQKLHDEADRMMSNAKARLGIFSERGIDEARGLLSDRVQHGNKIAKSMSWWDAIFIGVGSIGRDEGLLGYALRLIIQIIFNFFIALFTSCVSFIWGAIALARSFQASWPEAILFVLGCACTAASILLSFVLGVYLTGVTTVIGVTQIAALSGPRPQGHYRLR